MLGLFAAGRVLVGTAKRLGWGLGFGVARAPATRRLGV